MKTEGNETRRGEGDSPGSQRWRASLVVPGPVGLLVHGVLACIFSMPAGLPTHPSMLQLCFSNRRLLRTVTQCYALLHTCYVIFRTCLMLRRTCSYAHPDLMFWFDSIWFDLIGFDFLQSPLIGWFEVDLAWSRHEQRIFVGSSNENGESPTSPDARGAIFVTKTNHTSLRLHSLHTSVTSHTDTPQIIVPYLFSTSLFPFIPYRYCNILPSVLLNTQRWYEHLYTPRKMFMNFPYEVYSFSKLMFVYFCISADLGEYDWVEVPKQSSEKSLGPVPCTTLRTTAVVWIMRLIVHMNATTCGSVRCRAHWADVVKYCTKWP